MFEKEAEEYVIKKHHIDKTKLPIDFSLRCEFSDDFTDFQKGAVFGYNKCKEQLIKAKEIFADIIKFQPYIDRDAMFFTIGNDWKEVIFKVEQFIKDSEVEKTIESSVDHIIGQNKKETDLNPDYFSGGW